MLPRALRRPPTLLRPSARPCGSLPRLSQLVCHVRPLSTAPWAELRQEFEGDGYCVVPGVIDDELIAAIREFSTGEAEAMTPEQREEHRFTGSLIPVHDPVFQPLLCNEKLLGAMEALGLGGKGEVKWSCGFIISKPPGGPALAWHQDCAVWSAPLPLPSPPRSRPANPAARWPAGTTTSPTSTMRISISPCSTSPTPPLRTAASEPCPVRRPETQL